MTTSPVLFLVFSRPKPTARVFEAIRAAKPPRLYVSADGPRADRPDEAARCEEVRRITTQVDWPCEVKTLFRERNLGCKMGVAGGITWFFENEKEGIILEDDCLPHATFFPYCDELLERYRDDTRVMSIAATNIQGPDLPTPFSYYHSKFSLMWGWATWRRAWKLYDISMASWPDVRRTRWLYSIGNNSWLFASIWGEILDRAHRGGVDTWDYQWIYTCWREHGLTIVPATNLVRNLGHGDDATHTAGHQRIFSRLVEQEMKLPLAHPSQIELIDEADRFIAKYWFGVSHTGYVKQLLLRYRIVRRSNIMRKKALKVLSLLQGGSAE